MSALLDEFVLCDCTHKCAVQEPCTVNESPLLEWRNTKENRLSELLES